MTEKITEQQEQESVFGVLSSVNVNGHTEEKTAGGTTLKYLSWAWAWAEVKKRCPNAVYEIVKFDGLPYKFDEKTGYIVYTNVTIDGITHEMWLPVMDSNNKAMLDRPYKFTTKYGKEITVQAATMFDINKAIMRCLTKNLAMFGLGLYIYAGEDLPEVSEDKPSENQEQPKKPEEQAEKQELTEEDKNARNRLVTLCKLNNINVVEVSKRFGLDNTSKADDFTRAADILEAEIANGKEG